MDNLSRKKRSETMSKVKSKNTGPERKVRKALHKMGFRFRLHVSDLPGKPDIVLPKHHSVIQVRGCFWHGHSCKRGKRKPSTNKEYWSNKISNNKIRDSKNDRKLRAMGWKVIVIWECRINNPSLFDLEMHRIINYIRR